MMLSDRHPQSSKYLYQSVEVICHATMFLPEYFVLVPQYAIHRILGTSALHDLGRSVSRVKTDRVNLSI